MKQQTSNGNQTPLPSGGEGGGSRLSKNFTLEEMVATSHGKLQDTPSEEVIRNLTFLCERVLQPLRDAVGRPVYINSGYRSRRLNARVGGVPNSYHLRGLAADIHVDNEEHAKVLFDILKQNKWVDLVMREPSTCRHAPTDGSAEGRCGSQPPPFMPARRKERQQQTFP